MQLTKEVPHASDTLCTDIVQVELHVGVGKVQLIPLGTLQQRLVVNNSTVEGLSWHYLAAASASTAVALTGHAAHTSQSTLDAVAHCYRGSQVAGNCCT